MGWEAIQALKARDGAVGLSHFKLLRRLGCGDIGSVYLCELRGTDCYFAMKVSSVAYSSHAHSHRYSTQLTFRITPSSLFLLKFWRFGCHG